MTLVIDDREIGAEIDIDALVALPRSMTALEVFSAPFNGTQHPIDSILDRVHREVAAFEPDLTTPTGRKRIASIAYRVAQAKTALELVGKKVADEQKEIPKRIDATRRHVKDTLDALRDEVRRPLTDWEAAEESRVSGIKAEIAKFQASIDDRSERTAAGLRAWCDALGAIEVSDATFGEYAQAASELRQTAIDTLLGRIEAAEKREAEAAELAALRAEKAARERIEREADEAAERAARERRIAETAAAAAQKAAEDAAAERERKLQAEVAAAKKAVEDAAIEAAKQARAEAEAKSRREADKTHRAEVNRTARNALVENGISQAIATDVIKLIASGKVPAVSISY